MPPRWGLDRIAVAVAAVAVAVAVADADAIAAVAIAVAIAVGVGVGVGVAIAVAAAAAAAVGIIALSSWRSSDPPREQRALPVTMTRCPRQRLLRRVSRWHAQRAARRDRTIRRRGGGRREAVRLTLNDADR